MLFMDYKKLRSQLAESKTNCKKMSNEMSKEIAKYFQSSFAFDALWLPVVFFASLCAFFVGKDALQLTENVWVNIFAVIVLASIGIIIFTYAFLDFQKTTRCMRAIKNGDYYVVDGVITNIAVGKFSTIDTEINNADNNQIELSFETFYENELLEKRLEINEWPMVQFVCTDHGIFAFSKIDEHDTMLAAE